MYKNGQKQTKSDRKQQKQDEADKNQLKRTDTVRNWTETDLYRYKLSKTD